MTEDKHKIRNTVIGSLTTGAITALVVYLIPGGWAWVFSKGKSFGTWLGSPLSVPAWLVILLSLVALGAIIAIGFVVYAVTRKGDDGVDAFTEAEFFGVKWRWRYGRDGIYSITSYCPQCDLQIYPRRTSSYGSRERMTYRCDNGHWESQEFEGSQAEIENRIEREIHRQIRKKEDEAKRRTA